VILSRGSDVEAKSGRGYTALILASTAGEKEVVEHLIAQVRTSIPYRHNMQGRRTKGRKALKS
jgi:hypothetical protein